MIFELIDGPLNGHIKETSEDICRYDYMSDAGKWYEYVHSPEPCECNHDDCPGYGEEVHGTAKFYLRRISHAP